MRGRPFFTFIVYFVAILLGTLLVLWGDDRLGDLFTLFSERPSKLISFVLLMFGLSTALFIFLTAMQKFFDFLERKK